MNLLLVDDEIIAVKGMMMGIDWKACGIDGEVLIAYDAAQAMDILGRVAIDVMLCDIEMPGENGIQLIHHVQDMDLDVAVVFLTCHAKFEYAQEALRLGCEDYILTPAPYDVIAQAVRSMVDKLVQRRKSEAVAKYGAQWLDEQEKCAEHAQGDKHSAAEIAQETAQYILQHLASGDLSVSTLAKRHYLNEDYLNRVFKREKGVSLNQFIIQERMDLAARLLENQSLSIAAVAAQVGYMNYPYFVSTFKRFYNCTPTQYRSSAQSQ